MKIVDVNNNEAIQYLHEQLDDVIVNGNVFYETISMTLDALRDANSNKAVNKISDDNQHTKAIRIAIENLDK